MDTKSFLDVILPEAGRRCVGVLSNGKFDNYFGGSNGWAAEAVARIDAKEAETYFACAAYGPGKERKQVNVVAVRSFWIDIDTQEGKPKEQYANRKEAVVELFRFCDEVGLVRPWVVDSGYGIHAYWPCDEDIDPDAWKLTASLLKKATKQWGLAADPSRTSDSASVLRPIGAHNYKRGNKRPVRLLTSGAIGTHAEFHLRIMEYVGEDEEADMFGQRPDHVSVEDLNSDLKVAYAPSDANKVADNCAIIGEVRATRGDVDQPTWYAALGVLAFTEQGDEICHQWSDGYAGYSRSETQRKIEQARGFSPTTCDKLSDCRPSACAACPWRGEVKSPITLGTGFIPETVPEEVLPQESENLVQSTLLQGLPQFPDGYGYDILPESKGKRVLWFTFRSKSKGEDGLDAWVTERLQLAEYLLIPTARIVSSDDLYSMNLMLRDGKGRAREFVLDLGTVAESGKALFSELGRREVNVPAKLRPEMANYLNAWIGKLRDDYSKTPSIDQYGWHDDGFVIGSSYITPTDTRKAVLHGGAASMGQYLVRSGDLQTWIDAVDQAYNSPGNEPLQFCVLLSFAAPLWSLFGDNGGITVYAHSDGSGYGKSTAQQVGLSAWGLYSELMLRENNFTVAGLYQHIGIMKNLPVVIDEFTNGSKEFASSLAYNMSAGKGKTRLNADTSMKKTYNWSTITAASGNTLLTEKLSLHRADASAEMSRVWEFTVTQRATIDPNTALTLFGTFNQHYGHAGWEYAKYLVENRELIRQMLLSTRKAFNTKTNITQSERYWSALHACVLTALTITRKLGLLKFDTASMVSWIESTLAANRGQISQNVSDPLEQFGEMLADIFPGVLVTDGEGDLVNSAPAKVEKAPIGQIVGRVINGDKHSRAEMYISTVAAKEWCAKRGVSFKGIHDALVQNGWAGRAIVRKVLGKGTAGYAGLSGPVRCWDIQPHVIGNATGSLPSAKKVQQVIQGGANANGSRVV